MVETMTRDAKQIAVKGGTCVSGDGMLPADIYIRNGVIDAVERAGSAKHADLVLDASGQFVLPGIVDAHLHPVYADRIDTISQAAVMGGITTLIPYIGAVKAWGKSGNLLDAVTDFIEEGEQSSVVDFSIHGSLTSNDMASVEEMIPAAIDRGVISFKVFMAYARRGMMLQDEQILKIMEIIAEGDGLLAAHAENGSMIDYLEDREIAAGNLGPEFFAPSHPNISEAEAIFRILSLAHVVNCPLYLVHVTARESLDVIRLFKSWGRPEFFTETCTHYLTLTDEALIAHGSLAKMAPPLRKQEDVNALWQAVSEGLIDVIGSDAAGHTLEAKEPIRENIFQSPNGIPGIGTMFTVAYDEGVNGYGIDLSRLVRCTCENPAKIFGLFPRKGILKEGSDADILIFDPAMDHTVTSANSPLRTGYTLFEGRVCSGTPRIVMQRGRILLENGRFIGKAGEGRFIPGKERRTQSGQVSVSC